MTSPKVKSIANLDLDDLQRSTAWHWKGAYDGSGNEILSPVEFDANGRIPASVGETWCLSKVLFSGGATHAGCAMCRGDSDTGPLAWSVWNGNRFVPLIMPPAPGSVLKKLGPERFSAVFHLDVSAVFPLKLIVLPKFVVPPEEREICVGS